MARGDAPPEAEQMLVGLTLLAAGANVIMQLSMLPVGRGVAESRVDSGRADRHPLKRARTTLAYLAVALIGTDEDRCAYRQEVNRAHRQVHSRPGDPVAYDAFDPELQLWVAACLHKGAQDLYRLMFPSPDPASLDRLLAYNARLATTLQVPADQWPADRAAFDEYWQRQLQRIELDAVTRDYLLGVADQRILLAPLGRWGTPAQRLLAPVALFFTAGFLPPEFRRELGLDFSVGAQRRFQATMQALVAIDRRLPQVIRAFPYNVVLWDTRRRLAAGRRVV